MTDKREPFEPAQTPDPKMPHFLSGSFATAYLSNPYDLLVESPEYAFGSPQIGIQRTYPPEINQQVYGFERETKLQETMISYISSISLINAEMQKMISELNNDITRIKDQLEASSLTRNTYIFNLRSEKLKLITPIPVFIEHKKDVVTVSSADIDLFGEGETETEAMNDFTSALSELYLQLKPLKKKDMGSYIQQIRVFLLDIIKIK